MASPQSLRIRLIAMPSRIVAEAKSLIRQLIEKDLESKQVTDNAFGLEIYHPLTPGKPQGEKDWEEWDDGDGNDIMAVIDAEDEAAEQARRDEKNGLHGGKVDEAN
jgi:hypothetical protein